MNFEDALAFFLLALLPLAALSRQPFDWRPVVALAAIMASVSLIEEGGLFQAAASALENKSLALVAPLAYLGGALLTNDAAVLIFAPLVARAGGGAEEVSAVAALVNLGSSITPFGNPQNVLAWISYGLKWQSFLIMVPLTVPAAAYASLKLKGAKGKAEGYELNVKVAAAGLLSLAASVALVHAKMYLAALAASALLSLIVGRAPKVDLKALGLLALMIYDFGSVSKMINVNLGGTLEWMVALIALSQIISNVPAATVGISHGAPWLAVLAGSNLGGLGTPVASLANLIAIRATGVDSKEFSTFNAKLLALSIIWSVLFIKFLNFK